MPAAEIDIIASSDVMQPHIVVTDARSPKRAAWFITNNGQKQPPGMQIHGENLVWMRMPNFPCGCGHFTDSFFALSVGQSSAVFRIRNCVQNKCTNSFPGASTGMNITREELYRRVWLTPVRTLAKEFDISDVGLAKACRKHAIPLPPVGYWTKVQHGKVVPIPPLPSAPVAVVVLEANRNRPKKQDFGPLAEKKLTLQVEPPKKADHLAPYAQATLLRLRAAKPDKHGLVHSHGGDVFGCAVSLKSVERVCRIFHAIETAMPEVDSRLVTSPNPARLNFEFDEKTVEFRIIEKIKRTEIPADKRAKTYYYYEKYSYATTGNLSLEIEGYCDCRKKWADGVSTSLDDKLGDVVLGLVAATRSRKQWKIGLELHHQRWVDAERLAEENQRNLREEAEFKKQLLADGQTWRACQTAAVYVEQVRLELTALTPALTAKSLAWLEHAEKAIREMDPLVRQIQRLHG
jgi:hypothetical protein